MRLSRRRPVKANQPLAFRMEGQTKVFDMQAKPFKWEVLPGEFVDAFGYAGADGIASVPARSSGSPKATTSASTSPTTCPRPR